MRFSQLLVSLGVVVSVALPGCKSEEEKAADAAREAAAAEVREKAQLSIDEHEVNCDKGDAIGCLAVATAFQIGEDRPLDAAKAQTMFEKACDLGSAQGCLDASDKYLDAEAWDKALPLVTKGCEAENDEACTRKARVEQELKGGAEDEEEGDGAEPKAEGGEAGDEELSERERLLKEIAAAEEDDDEG